MLFLFGGDDMIGWMDDVYVDDGLWGLLGDDDDGTID
jgi:hypothetical protein